MLVKLKLKLFYSRKPFQYHFYVSKLSPSYLHTLPTLNLITNMFQIPCIALYIFLFVLITLVEFLQLVKIVNCPVSMLSDQTIEFQKFNRNTFAYFFNLSIQQLKMLLLLQLLIYKFSLLTQPGTEIKFYNIFYFSTILG